MRTVLGIGFLWAFDLSIIALAFYCFRVYLWKPFLNYFDLNKERRQEP